MSSNILKAPWHLWVVAILTLLFNAVGITSYLITHLGYLEAIGMTAEQIAFFNSSPVWANAAWAMGVWGAFLCSLFLLFRLRLAVSAIYVAIIGLVITTIYQRFMTVIPADLDSIPLSVMIWAVTLFLLWYSLRMRKMGVLR